MGLHPAMLSAKMYSSILCPRVTPFKQFFFLHDNVLTLWDIAPDNDTMMVDSVAEAWNVASLGFFMPELP